jgi:hypothetical protein
MHKTTDRPLEKTKGRPPKVIDWRVFEQLCEIQCTASEIASVLRMCEDTLYVRVNKEYGEHYSVIYKRFSEAGKCSLRRFQFKLAQKNTSMAIWLGKQWLGQKDISREEVKDIVEDLKDAIRESEKRPRIDEAQRPNMENQQSIPYQELSREEGKILAKLGTTVSL